MAQIFENQTDPRLVSEGKGKKGHGIRRRIYHRRLM